MMCELDKLMCGEEILPKHTLVTYMATRSISISKYYIDMVEECPLCGSEVFDFYLDPLITLGEALKIISKDNRIKMDDISIRSASRTLYASAPKGLRDAVQGNLHTVISDLIPDGTLVYITGKKFRHTIKSYLKFKR